MIFWLITWNLLCLAVPVALYLQPSVEPSIAAAVVLVFVAGPAAVLASIANVSVLMARRSVMSGLLTLASGICVCIWIWALVAS